MKWKKLGRVFVPCGQYDWMQSYSWVPVVNHLSNAKYRIYIGGRNGNNLTQTGYIDFDMRVMEVVRVSEEPVIQLGEKGAFDHSLALGCSIVDRGSKLYLYYVGWTQGKNVRYFPSIGLAISEDDGESFAKYSKAPVLKKTSNDYLGMASPFVIFEDGLWRMWYASYREWFTKDGEPWPRYHIRYAESQDGKQWTKKNKPCIDFENEKEEALARPWIITENNKYKMWYSRRSHPESYRIGYAESNDGLVWTRKDDEAGITTSTKGWDSEMVTYPCVFDHGGNRYMLYNGNSHGKSGLGIAVME